MPQFAIDVSEHQGAIDWSAVKAYGAHAIIRCGYGSDYESQDDKQWLANIRGAEANGVPHGVYLYSYATNTDMARSEAKHVLRLIQGRTLQYPVYFDSEQAGTEAVARECAIAFCEEIEAAGYWAGIYASRSWWQSNLGDLYNRYTPWVASWGSSDAGMAADMWQYTSDGECPGVSGRVDCNLCYRDFPAEIGGEVTVSDPAVPSQPSGSVTYTVQSGDTLSEIGERYGVSYQAIAAANGIANPDVIYSGQVLTIPTSSASQRTYTVQSGDCLSVIGERLGVDWRIIASMNGISEPYTIYPGQVLVY